MASTKKSINIAIIDSGIDINNARFKDKSVSGISIYKNKENNEFIIDDDFTDNIGHGTAITNIILSHNVNVNIFMLKIFFEENDFVDEETLLYCLQYLYDFVDFDILNLSIGLKTVENNCQMYQICEKIKNKNAVIISAFDNLGGLSYPAMYDNVIGVTTSDSCTRNNDIEFVEDVIVNICAKGRTQRVIWNNNKTIVSGGNSMACAHVTGIASNMHIKNFSYSTVMKQFREYATKIYKSSVEKMGIKYPPISKYKKVSIFPFNKEIHSLIRYERLLNFDIVDIYDTRYSSRVGAHTNALLNINLKNYVIKNIEKIDWSTFDTLVIGHCNELIQFLGNTQVLEDLINHALSYNKMIYAFDDIHLFVKKENSKYIQSNLFFPKVVSENVNFNFQGKLHTSYKPILAVFGTSSQQGKFSLQLIIREKLISQGYLIGQLGTEPTSYLFGMDECFNFGYNATTDLMRHSTIQYLNNAIYKISRKNVDLIITGSQSGIITTNIEQLRGYTFSQIEFLLGVQPDNVILCINIYDSIDIIIRSINFIKSCVGCSVIALVLFPLDLINRAQGIYSPKKPISEIDYISIKEKLENHLQVPLYRLSDENDMNELIACIIDSFS